MSMEQTKNHRHLYCPKCGKVLARTINIGGPLRDTITICIYCLAPLRFPDGAAMFMVYADLESVPIWLRNEVLRTIEKLRRGRAKSN